MKSLSWLQHIHWWFVDKAVSEQFDKDLNKSSFPHLSKEIAITENIISKSLSTNGKGMNIMFWGMPELVKQKWHWFSPKPITGICGSLATYQKDMEKKLRPKIGVIENSNETICKWQKTVLLFDEIEDIFNKQDNHAQFSKAFINHLIETTPIPIIWTTNVLKILVSHCCAEWFIILNSKFLRFQPEKKSGRIMTRNMTWVLMMMPLMILHRNSRFRPLLFIIRQKLQNVGIDTETIPDSHFVIGKTGQLWRRKETSSKNIAQTFHMICLSSIQPPICKNCQTAW